MRWIGVLSSSVKRNKLTGVTEVRVDGLLRGGDEGFHSTFLEAKSVQFDSSAWAVGTMRFTERDS